MARTSKRARRNSPLNLPSAFDLFSQSKNIVLKNIWIFGPLFGAIFMLGLLNWSLTPADVSTPWYFRHSAVSSDISAAQYGITLGSSKVPVLWALISLAVAFIIQIVLQKAQLDGSEHRPASFNKGLATVRQLGLRLVGLYLIVGIITVVGFILFIIPGFIMMRRYSMAPYIMMDRNTGIREAMDTSADMTKPYSGSVYGIVAVLFLIGLVSIVPIIGWLASFILGMLYCVAFALRYQQLKKITT